MAGSTLPTSKSATHGGELFDNLAEAHRRITSGKTSKAVQSRPVSPPPAPPPIPSESRSKSKDDSYLSSSTTAQSTASLKRRASFTMETFLLPVASDLNRGRNRLSLGDEIKQRISELNAQTLDNSGNTIEKIFDQYGPASAEAGKGIRERGASVSKPPKRALPEIPSNKTRRESDLNVTKRDSPALDSTVTDSQHLLDAEAQADELEATRRAVVPLPLDLPSRNFDRNLGASGYDDFTDPETGRTISRLLSEQTGQGNGVFWSPQISPVKRDSNTYSAGYPASSHPKFQFSEYDIERARMCCFQDTQGSSANPPREIKIVIGDKKNKDVGAPDSQPQHGSQQDDDAGDWVTEASSAEGFQTNDKGFKITSNSTADYTDDEDPRVGPSTENVLYHPVAVGYQGHHNNNVQTRQPKGSKYPVALPRSDSNAFPKNSLRDAQQHPKQHAKQHSKQHSREFASTLQRLKDKNGGRYSRLGSDFDKQHTRNKYAFRDSASDYDDPIASQNVNVGSCADDLDKHHERVPGTEQDSILLKEYPADKIRRHKTRGRGRYSLYAVDRQRAREEEAREIRKAMDARDQAKEDPPPTGNSMSSKFSFELIPLDQAKEKNKRDRYSGVMNETETGAARMPAEYARPQSVARPRDAHLQTGSGLSLDFTPPDWSLIEESPSHLRLPAAAVISNRRQRGEELEVKETDSSATTSRYYSNSNPFIMPHTSTVRRLFGSCGPRHPSGFTTPDDYVSDGAARVRRIIFVTTVILGVLPCVTAFALSGHFNAILACVTDGEVTRFTKKQRTIFKWELTIASLVLTSALIGYLTFVLIKKSHGH
ncbi:hypothetical protein F5Y16DRAFT_421497 [Xylariaceae sp. FL0255]|nr:hypothetical protein F5Y16DRAFT_421497 [Xylariaceae sp. FL0255]